MGVSLTPPPGLVLHVARPDLVGADGKADRTAGAEVSETISRRAPAQRVASIADAVISSTDWRLTLARDYLLAGELTLEQIADRTGYTSPNAFAATFRRHVWIGTRPVAPTALVEIAYSSLGRFKQATNCAALDDRYLSLRSQAPSEKWCTGTPRASTPSIAAEEPKLERAR